MIAVTTRRRAVAAVAAVAGLVSLGGCGVPERVVGLHDAPVENLAGAPFSEATAVEITSRVLTQAGAAMATSDSARATKEKVLTGPALRLAMVRNKFEGADTSLTTPATPTVLAISSGREWPRSILATSLSDGVQRLHVLTSQSPTAPYKLWVSEPMVPGASIPALPPLADGTRFGDAPKGLVAAPKSVLTAYGRMLDEPVRKKDSKVVTTEDAFASAIRSSSAAQKKALGSLGTFTRRHAVIGDDIMTVTLADGSVLAFGQLTRTDTLAPTAKARRLDLPDALAELADTESVTKELQMTSVVTLAMVIPAEEPAHLVGAGEQLRAITAD